MANVTINFVSRKSIFRSCLDFLFTADLIYSLPLNIEESLFCDKNIIGNYAKIDSW